MNEVAPTQSADKTEQMPVDAVLRTELAYGDVLLGTMGPIIGHLVASQSNELFSDEIIARVGAMVDSLANQILLVEASSAGHENPHDYASHHTAALAISLSADTNLLVHCHSRALEWRLAQRLEQSSGIDPILTPMIQALIASSDAETASLAMAVLAAQARFTQQMRRMELPLAELPGDLFHQLLMNWRSHGETEHVDEKDRAESELRAGFDERVGRSGLLSRLLMEAVGGVRPALSLSHAGVALFLSAISLGLGQDRDVIVQSTSEAQMARMALALRASGLKPAEIEEQFLHLHPEMTLPESLAQLRSDQAAQILTSSETGAPR